MTHHSFTTSEDLMAVLLKRYEVSPPLGIKDEATFQSWVESKLMPVKSQVLQVLSFWVTYQFADFVANDKALLVKLNEFLNVKALPDFPVKAAHIQDLLSARLASFDHPDSPINLKLAPKPILTKSVSKLTGPDKELQLLSVDETELARQWALVESSLFRQIGPKELINQIWGRTHESSKTKAPTISKMIEITSHMTYLVVAMILRAPNEKQRHAVVKYWVRVGQACAKLNNFNALTAIFGGFTSLPIKRLDRLWKTFKSAHPKSNELLGQLSELVSASGQYAAYRRALKACQPPCLPYLGVYITDLTLIEEGNQDYLPQNGSLINFEKRRKVATVIDEILARQQQCIYHLIAVPALQDFLTSSHERLSEVEAFKLSVAVEPLPEEDDEDDD
ncbi:ras guanine nucleotide exchange factor domain-containing protein [Blastocladiella britannica]|nr:ras guanine nucleotide exchange factor domain-containing protein [Blastocladiella britannica]